VLIFKIYNCIIILFFLNLFICKIYNKYIFISSKYQISFLKATFYVRYLTEILICLSMGCVCPTFWHVCSDFAPPRSKHAVFGIKTFFIGTYIKSKKYLPQSKRMNEVRDTM
jgi:hypothetical protein